MTASIHSYQMQGWLETISEGLSTIYLAIIDEGLVTGPTDSPANAEFKQRIVNAETFSIRRQPMPWFEGSQGAQAAAFGALSIVNYDGAFNFLLENDLRDATVVIKLPRATLLTTGTQLADTITICTAVVDSIVYQGQDIITINLKDTLARLDKVLPCRFNPPFVASGAANVMVPLTYGAFRNVQPLLVDQANRLFQIHAGNIPNITAVMDKAAPLDPHAKPPQYTRALNGSGIQLQTMPVGKLTIDGSSYGTQSVIAGVDDVLAGAGQFTGTWTGTPAVPPGWAWSNNAGSAITELNSPPYPFGTAAGAQLQSATVFNPGGGSYGDQLSYASVLQPNVTYRLNFSLYNVQQESPYFVNGMVGGVMVATALSDNAADYLTGIAQPLTTPAFKSQNFSLEFTVPAGSTRSLYFLVVPSAGNAANTAQGTVTATIFDVTLEQLGQFTSLPLSAMPLQDYYHAILVEQAGEDPSIYNASEAQALCTRTDATGPSYIPFAACFTSPPNILEALRLPVASLNGVIFTDADGVIRTRKFKDPSDPANQLSVKAHFNTYNVERPPQVVQDWAPMLTTLFGARPNQSVFSASDFVTDQAIVPQNTKTAYMRKSQIWVTASVTPSGMYTNAITAQIFDTALDLASDVQNIADEAVGLFSPKVYSNATSTTGQRRFVTFTAHFDDPAVVGVDTTCAVTDLMYGDIITLTYPSADGSPWFVNTYGAIEWWEIFPFAQKIKLTVRV